MGEARKAWEQFLNSAREGTALTPSLYFTASREGGMAPVPFTGSPLTRLGICTARLTRAARQMRVSSTGWLRRMESGRKPSSIILMGRQRPSHTRTYRLANRGIYTERLNRADKASALLALAAASSSWNPRRILGTGHLRTSSTGRTGAAL